MVQNETKNVARSQPIASSAQPVQNRRARLIFIVCLSGLLLCILLSAAPLQRLAGTTLLLQLTPGMLLTWAGAWLPRTLNLNLATDSQHAFLTSNNIEFQVLMLLAFICYGICALCIQRQAPHIEQPRLTRLIWLATLIAGAIFVMMPNMLSHDAFVYAGYGRLIAAHHANPYFVPLLAYPQDPITRLDDWSYALAAYGPLWLAICALASLLLGSNALGYILAFRLFALAAHLLNMYLIASTLRAMGRPPRTVILGTFLYALSPLVLLESGLGAHNDIFMITLILLGILLCVRGSQRGLAQPRNYLPPLLAFTLATLVKFTMLPIVALFLILLACQTLRPEPAKEATLRQALRLNWRPALLNVLGAGAVAICVTLVAYGPFWLGHSIHEIASSFVSPPSANRAAFSLLRGIIAWNQQHPLPAHTWLHALFWQLGQHRIWNVINAAIIIGGLLLGTVWLWRSPTPRTLVLATLLTLGGLLIVTPWFYPWYATWLVALATVYLPRRTERIGRGLLAFALTFSASAFMAYLFRGYQPLGGWTIPSSLTTVGPPVLAFLLFALWKPAPRQIR